MQGCHLLLWQFSIEPLICQMFRKALTLRVCKSSQSTAVVLKKSIRWSPLLLFSGEGKQPKSWPSSIKKLFFSCPAYSPGHWECFCEDKVLSCSLCTTFLKCLFLSNASAFVFWGNLPWAVSLVTRIQLLLDWEICRKQNTNQCIRDRGNVLCIRNGHSTLGKSQYEIEEIDVIPNPLVSLVNTEVFFTVRSF